MLLELAVDSQLVPALISGWWEGMSVLACLVGCWLEFEPT